MDVFKVGAEAPKAPAAAGARRPQGTAVAAARAAAAAPVDVVQTSGAAATVEALVAKVREAPEIRESVIAGYRKLLGEGALDTREAAQRAASAMTGA
ncbi:MAG TPA: hypothetical protein VEI02_12690 [Planctomycetota bacterium]|nr:hypothetical protein [Planctomycetota bacterium]